MLARLWWKEYRAFGPVWLILLGAAGLVQWFLLSVNPSEDVKTGGLTVSALAWAVLYAFAAGAAAFSGEREAKTLGFLDALPVGRWSLWLGKATFALVTTYGLALILAAIAALGTESRDPNEPYNYANLTLVFGTILFEAVAWSLLWSSLANNPLLAGVLSVLSVYFTAVVISVLPGFDSRLASNEMIGKESAPARWLAALGALAVSSLVVAWRPRRPRKAVRSEPPPRAATIRATSTVRSLVWQARREGWTTWLLVVVVSWLVPLGLALLERTGDSLTAPACLIVLASLVSGVSVFGVDNATSGRRFLVQHGVAAGTVWWRRFLVWAVAIGSIFGLPVVAALALIVARSQPIPTDSGRIAVLFGLALLNGFAIGLLGGMTITRRITAVLVGVIVLVLVLPLQLGAGVNEMVPAWSLFLVPAIFVAASRAWANDWLLEPQGFRPWARLGAWLIVPSLMLLVGFASYRAYSLTDIGPQYFAANLQPPAIQPADDAAPAYGRAVGLYQAKPDLYQADGGNRAPLIDSVIEDGRLANQDEVIDYWKRNAAAIEQARAASMMARGRFENVSTMTIFSGSGRSFKDLEKLSQLLAIDARARLFRGDGDVAGAWEDIIAQVRMASQLSAEPATVARMLLAARVHRRAVALAFDWLAASGQSPEILKKALADLKAVPAPPNAAATMRTESAIIERTLDNFDEVVAANLMDLHSYGFRSVLGNLWFRWVVAAPWERQRARRVGRLLVALGVPDASVEPHQRGPNPALESLRQAEIERGRMVTRMIMPNFDWLIARLDRMVVERRALEQAIAIEAWKLGHDGKYPEKLEALVPEWLASLPIDPYSGKSFGYTRSNGREVRSLFREDNDPGTDFRKTREGQPLLYSVGPGSRDDGGRSFLQENRLTFGDYVFPIP